MSRSIQYTILVLAALGALIVGMQLSRTLNAPPEPVAGSVPDSFAPFSFTDIDGITRNSSEWQGRTLLINFWATWCTPCREEIPVFSAVARSWKERGLEVIGIALDDAAAVSRFGDDVGLDYVSLVAGRDSGYALLETHNPGGALPFSVLVNTEGRIVERKLGLWHAKDLDKSLEALLNP